MIVAGAAAAAALAAAAAAAVVAVVAALVAAALATVPSRKQIWRPWPLLRSCTGGSKRKSTTSTTEKGGGLLTFVLVPQPTFGQQAQTKLLGLREISF